MPTSWRTVSLCLPLDEMACRSADAERSAAYPELTCEILGMPKPVAVPSTDDFTPGNVVALRTQAGERLDYLLCAHVQNARWLCHRGSFLDGHFDNDNPFDAADLVEKDVVREAWHADEKPTHRITRQPKLSLEALRVAVQNHEDDCSGVVAVATFKAEELRAGAERPLNEALAKANFERNPFLWGDSMRSRHLYALWTCTVEATILRSVVRQRLDHALDRYIMLPLEFDRYGPHQRVAYDHSRLVAIAEKATASTNLKGFGLACKYVQGGGSCMEHASGFPMEC